MSVDVSATRDRADRPVRDIAETTVPSPTAFPGAAVAGGLFGLALLVLAGILVRDVLAGTGAISGDTWTNRAADGLGTATWQNWMWVIPAVCAVVGLAALWLALKPRRRTHVNLEAYPVVWTRRADLARRCSSAVAELPGVRDVTTVAGRRRTRVTVIADAPVDREQASEVATSAVAAAGPPRVTVKIRSARKEALR
ncbi:hypothetical protein [Gordonia caeni]|uniref:Alkaline shock response membrane anchor protein AmaP n=1 Tax=Gordonia caeni TaxID=1007097 RepID=A0ABP7NJU5_9ACTN